MSPVFSVFCLVTDGIPPTDVFPCCRVAKVTARQIVAAVVDVDAVGGVVAAVVDDVLDLDLVAVGDDIGVFVAGFVIGVVVVVVAVVDVGGVGDVGVATSCFCCCWWCQYGVIPR